MEQLPVPADPKIPTSQQEAQDTVLRYMQQTIDALPEGFSLDGTRYMVGDGTAYCEDDPAGRDAPVHVEDWRDMKVPAGTDVNALIAQVGGIWEQWGWDVIERDGFDWRVHSTAKSEPGREVGMDIYPDDIHIMHKDPHAAKPLPEGSGDEEENA